VKGSSGGSATPRRCPCSTRALFAQQLMTVTDLPPDVVAAYAAPFPEERFAAGARQFPLLVPTTPDDPASEANRASWAALRRFEKPFLTAFSDLDPAFGGAAAPGAYTGGPPIARFFQEHVPGAQRPAAYDNRRRRSLPPGGPRTGARPGHRRLHRSQPVER